MHKNIDHRTTHQMMLRFAVVLFWYDFKERKTEVAVARMASSIQQVVEIIYFFAKHGNYLPYLNDK